MSNVAQRSPYNAAAFPAFFRPPAAGLQDDSPLRTATDNGPRTTDSVLRLSLVGANSEAKVSGLDELPGKSNYFIGNDPKKWRTNVPTYAKVKYEGVYPGIDLVYHGNPTQAGQLEYDFVVAPGADPSRITLDVDGAVGAVREPRLRAHPDAPLRIDRNGDLVVKAEGGEVRFHKPVVYQPQSALDGRRSNADHQSSPRSKTNNEPQTTNVLDGKYVLKGSNQVTFEVASYDRSKPLIIDPVLAYSTFLGGSDYDRGDSIAVDGSGNAYVTGATSSTDFPTTPGAFQESVTSFDNAFVIKLNASGSALVYSTFLGGSYSASGWGIALDSSGDAYVIGLTFSPDFPTTPGAFQTTYGGGGDAFVTKLNPTGSALVYSSYLGGSEGDWPHGIALDSSGNAYVTGEVDGVGCGHCGFVANFPTVNPFQPNYGGGPSNAFVTKVNAAGSALVYSTYLGSYLDYAYGIAVDASGNAYVTGFTASPDFPTTAGAFRTTPHGTFVCKLSAAGSALVYSTSLGGTVGGSGSGIAVDSSGNAYVTGYTSSADFPVTSGAYQTSYGGQIDAFVVKLNAAGSALLYSTYLGGSGPEDDFYGTGSIAVDTSGNAYVTGYTYSADFPVSSGAFQKSYGGKGDAFVVKLNAAGSALLYSTYLGGSGLETVGSGGIAVDASGNAYVTGTTLSTDFPTSTGAFQTSFGGGAHYGDAFVAKISPADVPGIALSSTTLAFGNQPVGTTSSPQTITVRNVGSQPLVLRRIVSVSIFPQTNTCGTSLEPGETCTIGVVFAPKSRGAKKGFLFLVDNVRPRPVRFIWMTGTGT